ncbi:alanine racemase [Poseidonocella pacifica]|uniref:alanine racemase n=1 Tax=Poseidonocella pacifica TaxID=871651 RepID=UPI002482104E|nr:alanine racemase [Poseidonocella pacifica]
MGKIRENTRFLVDALRAKGIRVAGVTKAVCGDPAVAGAMQQGGVSLLADARISNVARLRSAGITCPIELIRSPMPSEVDRVVETCAASYNTEMEVIADLSASALRAGKVHGVILMVEMGDMRDGICPHELGRYVSLVAHLPGVALSGIGANFACLGNVSPDDEAMAAFSDLVKDIEIDAPPLKAVSGGGSANLPWAFASGTKGRVNELRLGEAILLGTDPVSGDPIDGLHTDAFRLVAEVIEANCKTGHAGPRRVECENSEAHLGEVGATSRIILALGMQDTDVHGLTFPPGVAAIGATSDHTVLCSSERGFRPGAEIRCGVSYGALMRAMNARDVERVYVEAGSSFGQIGEPLQARPTTNIGVTLAPVVG